MREATRRSPVPVYSIESGLPGEMRSIATGAPDSSTIVVCLVTTYRNGAGFVSVLTTTVCEPGTYSVNAPFVVVTVVVVCARSSVRPDANSNGEQSHANFGDVYLHIMGIRSREQTWPQKNILFAATERLLVTQAFAIAARRADRQGSARSSIKA